MCYRERIPVLALGLLSFTQCVGTAFAACPEREPYYATGESTTAGTVAGGDYWSTQDAGGQVETLVEQDATIGPPPKRADLLEHTWTFSGVPDCVAYKFTLTAWRQDAGGDGDNFSFAYSTDGGLSWRTMMIVDSDSESLYEHEFQATPGGTLLVRAVDTDRTGGRKYHATLYVDQMYFEGLSSGPEPDPGVSAKRIIGYYTSWSIYAREYYINEHEPGADHIPAGKVTHINYAFANLAPDGTVVLGDEFADVGKIFGNEPPGALYKGNFMQLNILKNRYAHIRTFISVGGWTWSDHFSDVFADQAKRGTFCSSLLDFVARYGFDGADIDWEYPGDPGEGDNSYRPGFDKVNFVAALAQCRPDFDAAGKMLSVATPCNPQLYTDELDLAGMMPYLDWVNPMSYDLHGPWDALTGHHSQLYENAGDPFADGLTLSACVQGHITEGVPPEKINAGVPSYGRAYANVSQQPGGNPSIRGLFQPFSGVPKGTWDGGRWGTTGVCDYEDIVLNILPKGSPDFDAAAKVPTLTWNLGKKQGMGFLSYDNTQSVCQKAQFAIDNGLGGLMFWEFSADIENDQRSLILAMYCGLNPGAEACASVCP